MTAKADVSGLMCHARQVVRRRYVLLGDLLPRNDLRWLAVLTHGYVHGSAGGREIKSFSDIGVTGSDDATKRLSEIRNSGDLIEGAKCFPDELAAVLLRYSGERIWVRNGEVPVSIEPGCLAAAMREVDPDYDFEASAGSGEWYLRFRDDDALIFIAATQEPAEDLKKAGLDHVLPVGSDFVFAA